MTLHWAAVSTDCPNSKDSTPRHYLFGDKLVNKQPPHLNWNKAKQDRQHAVTSTDPVSGGRRCGRPAPGHGVDEVHASPPAVAACWRTAAPPAGTAPAARVW